MPRARAVVGAVATPSPRDSAWKGVLTHAPKPCPSFDSETPYQWVKAYFASVTGMVNVWTLAGDVAVMSAL